MSPRDSPAPPHPLWDDFQQTKLDYPIHPLVLYYLTADGYSTYGEVFRDLPHISDVYGIGPTTLAWLEDGLEAAWDLYLSQMLPYFTR